MNRDKVLQNKDVNNKGMTLVEVLVAMMILTIVSMVLLQGFVSATRYNKKAREKQRCLHVAQSVMEGFKAYDLESIASQFNHQSDFRIFYDTTNPVTYSEADRTSFTGGKFVRNTTAGAEDKYHFVMSNVLYDGNKYEVDIALEPDDSAEVTDNEISVPEVPEFNKYNDGFCTMKTPSYEKNFVYKDCLDFLLTSAQVTPNIKAGTVALTEEQKAAVKFNKRTITININEVDGSTIVDVKSTYDFEFENLEYKAAGIGGGVDTDEIVSLSPNEIPDTVIDSTPSKVPEYEAYNNRNTRPFANLNNIYVYYTPDYDVAEEIKVINNTGGTYTVYLIKQRVGVYGDAGLVVKESSYNPTIISDNGVLIRTNAATNLYNGADLSIAIGSGVTKDLYETSDKILEYKVTINVKNSVTGDTFELVGSMFDK